MGQALSSETHSISGGDGYKYWVGLHMKVQQRGCKKAVYKGILLGTGPRWGERVVVKAFTNVPGNKEHWKHEVVKADATKQMITMFRDKCPQVAPIRVVMPGLVQMDKVSKVNRWLEDRSGNRSICKDDWVSVEEHIPGEIKRFCPWNSIHEHNDISQSNSLEAFSHFTFLHSQGTMVACDFQGVMRNEGASSTCSYVITDSIIHSLLKEYGPFDYGEDGINEFFKLHKCSSICRGWPVPTPLTPPPSFSSLSLTPPPAFEDLVFPFPHHSDSLDRRRPSSLRGSPRRRHATEDGVVQSRSSNSFQNHLNVPFNNEQQARVRSRSFTRDPRLRSENENVCHDIRGNTESIIVPSAPPLYEDCIKENVTSNSTTFF